MKKETFLTQFLFNSTLSLVQQNDAPFTLSKQFTRAAVLIPIVEQNNRLEVVLTLRASHLKHHAGQISFPGGKVEKYDVNEMATALRETHEEIGVSAENITVIGTMPSYQTITGYHITPVLGFIKPQLQYCLDTNEVAEIFHVPLSHFLNTNNHISLSIYRNFSIHPVYFMPYKHYNIWGVTASILKKLAEQLQP
ncbi:CoA pyrophosphatase [Thalassotalea piscium]|uniref:8-oxo-dGTP pyrophosphatase MutT (NUDIX family) n=1 Tax=Thalassotalea piscium TaxID=1230533 RepID=A0A7X0TUA4_9GAMM|nr:CoA pyrophosphatase [Thalassotalea piscium]MBB6543929.1 8-oxo-dGTP pyrophosphatase MutT (NUDIX family) [Thalassotalea piscium]